MNPDDQNQSISLVGDCLLRLRDLVPVTGKSEGAMRLDLHRGKFPIPVFYIGRSVRFRLSDVKAYLANGVGRAAQ